MTYVLRQRDSTQKSPDVRRRPQPSAVWPDRPWFRQNRRGDGPDIDPVPPLNKGNCPVNARMFSTPMASRGEMWGKGGVERRRGEIAFDTMPNQKLSNPRGENRAGGVWSA